MQFTRDDTYRYSVIDVAQTFHYSYCGSGDPLMIDELKKYIDWMKWRLSDGWKTKTNISFRDMKTLCERWHIKH
jgi:hypothetical protein